MTPYLAVLLWLGERGLGVWRAFGYTHEIEEQLCFWVTNFLQVEG